MHGTEQRHLFKHKEERLQVMHHVLIAYAFCPFQLLSLLFHSSFFIPFLCVVTLYCFYKEKYKYIYKITLKYIHLVILLKVKNTLALKYSCVNLATLASSVSLPWALEYL